MTSKVDEALSYEQARDELIEVVRRLEAGGTTLEESLALWERGEELAKVCRRWLEGARARLDAALAEEEGAPKGRTSNRYGHAGCRPAGTGHPALPANRYRPPRCGPSQYGPPRPAGQSRTGPRPAGESYGPSGL